MKIREFAASTGNKRLDNVIALAVEAGYGGGCYALDGYNGMVMKDGLVYAITTRTFGDNNHFLMEIYED